jgi:hypothetical protein
MKKKKNDSPIAKDTNTAVKRKAGQPPIISNAEQMQTLIDEYFNMCDRKKEPYTMSGLAYHLGMDRRSLVNYSHRDEFFLTLKRARERVETYLEKALMEKDKPTGIIFNLKNNFGWVDKQEISQDIKLDAVSINVNLSEDE